MQRYDPNFSHDPNFSQCWAAFRDRYGDLRRNMQSHRPSEQQGNCSLVINTPSGQAPRADEVRIRTTAVYTNTPIMTTLIGARAAALGLAALKKSGEASGSHLCILHFACLLTRS